MYNFVMGLTLVVLFSLLCIFVLSELEAGDIRADMYAECLESKYDKFQCYSMIYGAK